MSFNIRVMTIRPIFHKVIVNFPGLRIFGQLRQNFLNEDADAVLETVEDGKHLGKKDKNLLNNNRFEI